MKTKCFILLSLILLGCSSDNNNNNCNLLLNVGVNFSINLDLPQFSPLLFPSNAIRVENQGNAGVILIRTNGDTIRAWDGADPNLTPSACSRLEIDGILATSSCADANQYSLLDGQIVGENSQPCTLREYRVLPIGGNSYSITN